MNELLSRQFLALVKNTVRREARSRTLIFMGFITVLVIIITNLSFNFLQDYTQQYMDIGDKKLFFLTKAINFWASFMGLYFGISALKSDEESGVQPLLLSFPIPRVVYLSARFCGVISIVFIYYVASLVLATVLFSLSKTGVALTWGIVKSLAGTSLVVMGSSLIGLFMSLFFTRSVSMVIGFILLPIISISNMALVGKGFKELFQDISWLKFIGLMVHLLLPRITVWSDVTTALMQDAKVNFTIWPELLHFVGIFVILWWILAQILKRRGI